MRYFILFTVFCFAFFFNGQDCEKNIEYCRTNLKKGNKPFLSDGQVYSALLEREKAEFKTTFFW